MKEGMTGKEGMTIKEGNMMNEGKNENEWMMNEYLPRADWLLRKKMNDEWRKECEGRKNDERRNCKWRNEYLPRTVMTVGMNDECRNEWKWMMLKEWMKKNDVKGENDYLPSTKWM